MYQRIVRYKMEVEMKAKITDKQANDIIEGHMKKYCLSRGGGWEGLFKSDKFFSFNGERPYNPENIIRIRQEAVLPMEASFEQIIHGVIWPLDPNKTTIKEYLTVKEKKTDEDGIETNKETEGVLEGNAGIAFRQAMEIANFKPYFSKYKTSVSFYVKRKKDDKEMHCEIVNTNHIGPFLEIEVIVPDSDYVRPWECQTISEAQQLIKDFFKDVLGITKFDKRSWPEIIEQDGEKALYIEHVETETS